MKKLFTSKNHLFYCLILFLSVLSCGKMEKKADESSVNEPTEASVDTAAVAVDSSASLPPPPSIDSATSEAPEHPKLTTSSPERPEDVIEKSSSTPPPPILDTAILNSQKPPEPIVENAIIRHPASITAAESIEIKNSAKTETPIDLDTKIGKIAFFCESENLDEDGIFEMKEERPYEMIAMLNPIIENDDIKTEIVKVINETRIDNRQPPIAKKDITTRDIILGNYISIQIKNPDKKLIVQQVSNDSTSYTKRIYDEVAKKYINQNFEWRWTVTPAPNSKGQTKLVLIISPLNKNKERIKEKIKTYDIDIKFKQGFLASLWEKMNRNIEWAITAIIGPILAFLAGRFTKKKE